MRTYQKVIVLGLDGLEPKIVEPLLQRGELPHLGRLVARGGYARLATTTPAQTPVAWSTFATGTNPGGHGVFDFLRRNPQTYHPDVSLYRFEQKNAFVAPRPVNLRRGTPLWNLLTEAGLPSTVIRCPGTFPPDEIRGRMLSGLGVPDLRGSFSSPTFFTSRPNVTAGESEYVVHLTQKEGIVRTQLPGPRNPRTGENTPLELTLKPDLTARTLTITAAGAAQQLVVREGNWSDWLRIKLKTGMFQAIQGMVRFLLVAVGPELEVYASPIQFDPEAPRFPISSPPDYAAQLAREIGPFYTAGMVEDHAGLNNERFDERVYLHHCAEVMAERERMMLHELNRTREGFFFCLFDTPDRLQHMFWRFQEPNHPANRQRSESPRAPAWVAAIEEHYRACDAVVGKALEFADDRTLFAVLSDHGFNSFRRGVHLNGWLHAAGLLKMKPGCRPGAETETFFQGVDWSQTRAYAVGLSGIYLNLRGREGHGIVSPDEAPALKSAIAEKLAGLRDDQENAVAIRSVATREQVYAGPFVDEAPDLLVNFAAGYRVSWPTALGGVAEDVFEDNVKKWSGDHLIDPALVPGVLFLNHPFRCDTPRLTDLAPTILQALGVPKGPAMEGNALLP
jgi:predicted AlkP superfamily phosphohydrolase/phosphomutase